MIERESSWAALVSAISLAAAALLVSAVAGLEKAVEEKVAAIALVDSSWHGWPGMRTKGVRKNWLRFN